MEINTLSDPARFAQAIRGLARDAHQTLTHSPSAAALRGLSRRIELLASALGDRRGGPLGTWLDSQPQFPRYQDRLTFRRLFLLTHAYLIYNNLFPNHGMWMGRSVSWDATR